MNAHPDSGVPEDSGSILTHRSRTSAEGVTSTARPIDVLTALVDRPRPFLVRHHGLTLVGAEPAETASGTDVWEVLDLPLMRGAVHGHPLENIWVGLLSYEFGGSVERLPHPRAFPDGPAEAGLARYPTLAAHDERTGWIVIGPEAARRDLADLIRSCPEPAVPQARQREVRTSLSVEEYRGAVEAARELIAAGDCYQVNLAQRLSAAWEESATDLAQRLWRFAGATSHRAFLGLPEGDLISVSPERLVSVAGGTAVSEPIKGTAPHGAPWPEIATPKNQTEHVMIVDLIRNDLGRVARIGGVSVPALMRRLTTPYVDHMVSTVQAELAPDVTAQSLLRALFPGGSVTGAPKIRSMEVISQLEPVARGPAYGSVISVARDGSLDASVAIRTAWLSGGTAYYWCGGAIVWDSDPDAECDEAWDKGAPFLAAVGAER